MTPTEEILWECLRKRRLNGYRFRRQVLLGRYIADFACLEARLVIELDGQHHLQQQEYDQVRDNWMRQQEFKVLRFWNDQVINYQESVLKQISKNLEEQSRDLSTLDSRKG